MTDQDDIIALAEFDTDVIVQANECPTLGPEYFAGRRIAERMFRNMEPEFFKPFVDKAADEMADALWDKVRDSLLMDTEYNVHGAIRHMVEQTVFALLSGQQWAMERYPYEGYSSGAAVRKAIADEHGRELYDRYYSDPAKYRLSLIEKYRYGAPRA